MQHIHHPKHLIPLQRLPPQITLQLPCHVHCLYQYHRSTKVWGLWEQGEADNNPWEGYDELHLWRNDDNSSDSWHSGQTMGSDKDYVADQDNRSNSWHTCPMMGSSESNTSSNPHDPPHTTNYDTNDEEYEQRTRMYVTTSWDVPLQQEHSELNHVLTYVVHKRLPDYTALWMLGQCEPINDFMRLCQHLCMDGTTQWFSGEIQTADFNYSDLEELFYNLEWHLCSKSVINSFYESCGFEIPYPPLHEQGTKIFRSLSHEWERWSKCFGPAATAKYLHKREETSVLYLFIFQNDWFTTMTLHYLQKGQYLPQPENSFWWQIFWQDHALYNKVLDIEGHLHMNEGFDAGYMEAST